MLAAEDLVVTDLNARQLPANASFSSELACTSSFYNMRPDVNAICHAHPPTATGLRLLDADLIRLCFPKLSLGSDAFL